MPRIGAFKVTRALIARLLFALHSLMTIWVLYADSKRKSYWAFAVSPILLFVEGAFTILLRHGDEYKWFCPAVFIFLCGSVPPIWLLELKTTWGAVNNITHSSASGALAVELKWIGYIMIELPQLSTQIWLQIVEQSLLVILILGRWLLPKGRITRDELSQLLLAYLAVSADIIELFNLFQETKVRMNLKLSLMVLVFWSVSLIQFPMVITTVKGQKVRHCFSSDHIPLPPEDPKGVEPNGEPKDQIVEFNGSSTNVQTVDGERRTCWKRLREMATDVRVWGILSTILIQDLPFWALRMYLLLWEEVMSYTMFFFLCKNALIMAIQIYRLVVICCEKPGKSKSEDAESARPKVSRVSPPRFLLPLNSDGKKSPSPTRKTEKINDAGRNGSVMMNNEMEREGQRPSLHITGSVDVKDILAVKSKPRKDAPTFAQRFPVKKIQDMIPKRKKHQNSVAAMDPKHPPIKLASQDDTAEDLDSMAS